MYTNSSTSIDGFYTYNKLENDDLKPFFGIGFSVAISSLSQISNCGSVVIKILIWIKNSSDHRTFLHTMQLLNPLGHNI